MDATDTQTTEFKLNISLDGDAMQSPDDIARQLRKVAQRLEAQGAFAPKTIMDENGNAVGKWSITNASE